MSRLGKAYKDFHDVEPTRETKVKQPEHKRAWAMGYITRIYYTPYYLQEDNPGIHKNTEFVHRFTDKGSGVTKEDLPILAASDNGKDLIIVRGKSKYYITRRGIIG
ncbi:MAG: hypothetical protein Q8O55_01185 [Dehalococcoidales bacterium]|nr:hypothetical protein [Dehalococcoidales bacterium]